MKPSILFCSTLLVLASLGSAASSKKAHTSYSLFSTRATDVWDNISPSRPMVIQSPDGLNVLKTQWPSYSADLSLILASRSVTKTIQIGKGIGSEVMWAPDSRAFSVTTSNVGGNGPYETHIYYLESGEIREVNPTALVRDVVDPTLRCDWEQTANVIAIAWLRSSKHLLVAGQVPHHSVCRNMGTFTLFEIQLPEGNIVHTYSQAEAKRRFSKYLGKELRDAGRD
ncbi:MAG: hypothetical protein JWO13_1247 [Acidobacteriales bacterium]|nr:hypothetical protein [Terriglobales bacterium]